VRRKTTQESRKTR